MSWHAILSPCYDYGSTSSKLFEEEKRLDASFGTRKLLLRVNTCIAEKPYTLQKCFSNLQGLGCEESRILFTT
jgi:hypothetical protein